MEIIAFFDVLIKIAAIPPALVFVNQSIRMQCALPNKYSVYSIQNLEFQYDTIPFIDDDVLAVADEFISDMCADVSSASGK